MYQFKREDTGEIVEVPFEEMICQDAGGYIVLDDGVRAKRVHEKTHRAKVELNNANHKPPVSDHLGVTEHQVAEFRADAEINGFTGVEFKPDPECPKFYQCHFSSMSERDKYLKHRGKVDRNRTKGNALTPKDFENAVELIGRKL